MMKFENKLRVEYIKWWDHFCGSGWQSLEDVEKSSDEGMPIESLGFMLHENDKYVVIASTADDKKMSTTRQYILKTDIIKRKRL